MKKISKKFVSLVLAVAMIISMLSFIPETEAKADTIRIPSTARCGVGMENARYVDISLPGSGYKIYKLKVSNSQRLRLKVTSSSTYSGSATLGMYATKKGIYYVSFYVKSKTGRIVGSKKTIKVYASGDGGVIRSLSVGSRNYDGKSIYTSQNRVRVKLTVNAGIRVKKIEIGRYSSVNGEMKYVTIKNGGVTTISNCGWSSFHEYDDGTYYHYQEMYAPTEIRITYLDKCSSYPNDERTTSVWVYKRATRWAF